MSANPTDRQLGSRSFNSGAWLARLGAFGFVFDVAIAWVARANLDPGLSAFSAVVVYWAACWVGSDSRRRGIWFPADLALLWFWIGFPAYLYESKGWKGMLWFVGLVVAFLTGAYLWSATTHFIVNMQY